ncbi:uncharacterized protein F5147DRAFT_698018 [Suillus discolor]|uniref:Uncharacterized protein n=1 Tax=Suillus discolor TaxID=1912936 RepID=A0A9P7F6C0_9AGAM|nr:uncharacterized protein F5147DRAFT_698018 [Suillus discolor]KAG2107202.1 hypothetical protein F5147DRAFT_698018 [Suillus discolor]
MPAKYSHVKKRSTNPKKKAAATIQSGKDNNRHQKLPNHLDKTITNAMSAVSQLEPRYRAPVSTHIFCVALIHLPTFMMRCITVGGPSWVAYNADSEEIKDFFRSVVSMDLRQAGERVSTKSALSNNVPVCRKRGLHSLRLLPHYDSLKVHMDSLEAMPHAAFTKPPHLGALTEGLEALEEACELKYGEKSPLRSTPPPGWDHQWRMKVRTGYERLAQTLWRVTREFDVSGYGCVLREKLTTKWCDCGCSTDHLGEVCEKTVREDEEGSGVRSGKQREWDGRGSGVLGWETEEEEDIWDIDLDFGGSDSEEGDGFGSEMTIAQMMEIRFIKAEREKEFGNAAFRRGEYQRAVKHYKAAHSIEPELPHYQLNLAAAHLKLSDWLEAEEACTKALGQHRSIKGYYRRSKARRMLGKLDDAVQDLRAALKIQPSNSEALDELISILPPDDSSRLAPSSSSLATSSSSTSPAPRNAGSLYDHLHLPKLKQPKQLPFPRSSNDDRKIKVSSIPVSYEVPLMAAGKASTELKSKDLKTRTESFIFPSWEKYTVRLATG